MSSKSNVIIYTVVRQWKICMLLFRQAYITTSIDLHCKAGLQSVLKLDNTEKGETVEWNNWTKHFSLARFPQISFSIEFLVKRHLGLISFFTPFGMCFSYCRENVFLPVCLFAVSTDFKFEFCEFYMNNSLQ